MSGQENQNAAGTQQTPSWFHPEYPPLNSKDDVGQASIEGQVVEYPQVVRNMTDPPIIGQGFGNLSFMLFEQPRMFRGKPIYGYVKMRGNHLDDKAARYDAYRIVREIDSKFQIRIAKVGVWVPITENDSVVQDMFDVRENDEQKLLRDEAVKEKEAESRRIARELRDAEEKLKEGGDIYDNPESLDFYTMKRVTEMRLAEAVDIAQRKVDDLTVTLAKTHILLRRLETMNPQHVEGWVDNYNRERSKTSLPDFVPGEDQFSRYDATTLAQLEADYPELAATVTKEMGTYGVQDENENTTSSSATNAESADSEKL